MNQRSARLTARRWVTVNAMIAGLARLGTPRVTLRYEDLVRDPRTELARIAALTADVTGVTDPLAFLTATRSTQAGSHAVAGGRIRMRTGPIALSLDEKWRRGVPPGAAPPGRRDDLAPPPHVRLPLTGPRADRRRATAVASDARAGASAQDVEQLGVAFVVELAARSARRWRTPGAGPRRSATSGG